MSEPRYILLSKFLRTKIIEPCGILQSKYVVIGSFALRKHRDITDLDICMNPVEFEKLRSLEFGEIALYNNQTRWFYQDEQVEIEIFSKLDTEGYPDEKFSLLGLQGRLDIDENGHQFLSLEALLDWKRKMGRQKDQADIELLESLLN
jgi:hypothetical protein